MRSLTKYSLGLVFLIALGLGVFANGDHARPYLQDSLASLEATYEGEPFLLSIWSIECAPCLKELKALGELKAEYPDFNLILLSVDSIEYAEDAEEFLAEFNLSDTHSWMYGSTATERLRYSVDDTWYGEMPRSYFYDAGGKRQSKSGLLTAEILQAWLESL